MASKASPEPIPTVPLPSADLINYRFDELKGDVREVKDIIGALSHSFVTKEDSDAKRREYDRRFQEIDDRFAAHRWYWRAIFSAATLALATAVAALIIKG